jgi:O-succinylbenzoate synthase
VALAGAADVVVLKVAPLRGVAPALEVRRAAGCRSSCRARSTPPSASAPAWRSPPPCPTCRTPAGSPPPGLLAGDVVAEPLTAVDGHLPVGAVAADPGALERWAAPPDRAAPGWRGHGAAGAPGG